MPRGGVPAGITACLAGQCLQALAGVNRLKGKRKQVHSVSAHSVILRHCDLFTLRCDFFFLLHLVFSCLKVVHQLLSMFLCLFKLMILNIHFDNCLFTCYHLHLGTFQ